MKPLFLSDDAVLISRVSALLDAENIDFVVLGAHASLWAGGIGPIQTKVMVEENKYSMAVRLIREENLANDLELIL